MLDGNLIPLVGNGDGCAGCIFPAASGGVNVCFSRALVHNCERALCTRSERRVLDLEIFQYGARLKGEFHKPNLFNTGNVR